MQTVLGSTGVIGRGIAMELAKMGVKDIRLVSRNPKPINEGDQLFSADLLDRSQAKAAIAGSDIVYLAVGLPYNTKVWEEQWPIIMEHVVEGCIEAGAKLVFFDNVYMYGKVTGWMTEDCPHKPISKKGVVRARIAKHLLNAMGQGKVQGLIARAADFYGPTPVSVIHSTLFERVRKGQKAQWLGDPTKLHSFTYTRDAAWGTALLGNTEDAFGRVWHLPTDPATLTGEQWVQMVAQLLDQPNGYTQVGKTMVRLLSLFVPIMRELPEMWYQVDSDYLFDSSAFVERFGKGATPYAEGLREMLGKG
jgi:nucleoside-diphosphate-sugar epimerase